MHEIIREQSIQLLRTEDVIGQLEHYFGHSDFSPRESHAIGLVSNFVYAIERTDLSNTERRRVWRQTSELARNMRSPYSDHEIGLMKNMAKIVATDRRKVLQRAVR